MFSNTLSAVAAVLAASSIVSAQTTTDCNPLKTGKSLTLSHALVLNPSYINSVN